MGSWGQGLALPAFLTSVGDWALNQSGLVAGLM
jgi:hypothetical protein